jgi:hypothetical protein
MALVMLLAVLCFLAYLPAVSNGFMSDDFVILQRLEILKTNPWYLLKVPPENFRLTSYLVFGALKGLVGYRYQFFYVFSILLHLLNTILLWRFVLLLTRNPSVAALAAVLFVVFKAPREAVAWLAAMNETLLGLFILATLICWFRDRYWQALLFYLLALFSKESAVIVLALIPLFNLYQGKRPFSRPWLLLLAPTCIFGALMIYTWSANFMIGNKSYALGPHAALVVVLTLHKLLWPWFWIALIGVRFAKKRWSNLRRIGWILGCVMVPLMPYMFIIYQNNLPSRQLYLASAVFVSGLATLLVESDCRRLQYTVVAAFLLFNIGYMWSRARTQDQERAAPTKQLISELRKLQPAPTLILDFPQIPIIANATTGLVPGWRPELLVVALSRDACKNCRILQWNRRTQCYEHPSVGQ